MSTYSLSAAIAVASAALNSTEAVLVSLALQGTGLVVGSCIEIDLAGTCTSSAANTSTFTVRYGAAGTTADATMATFVLTAAAGGTSVPFSARLLLFVRTVGASATVGGTGLVVNGGATGIVAANAMAVAPTVSAVNLTADGIVSVAYKASASTTTATFQVARIRMC